jgi:DNA-binding CsgD family transcriptional regulator
MDSVEQAREVLSAAEQALGTHAIPPRFGDDDLDSAAVALSAVRHTLSECLAAEADEKDPARARQIAAILMRSEHAQAAVLDAVLARRASQVLSARDAVGRLREAWSTKGLIDRAAEEAHRIGFDRILFSRLDHGLWLTSSAYAGADEQFAHTLVEAGQAHPRKLIGTLEGEMVRRGAPMVVRDPQLNPHVYTELVTLTETQAYVAAPVLAWGQPIGLIHADRQAQSVLVDESDRDVLSVFAEGLGIAFERNLLLDRLRTVRQACNDYARGINALADDVTIGVVEGAALGEGLESSMPAAPGSTQPPAGVRDNDGGVSEPLTRREWDVLHGLATGKTNAQIAVSLFVAEGTVKTHVKHVLRKLGAANRTEAVAKYHRMIN